MLGTGLSACADSAAVSDGSQSSHKTAMAPKRAKSARARPKTNVSTDDTANNDTTEILYAWSGRPMDKPAWFYGNRKTLLDEVPGAERFLEFGVTPAG